MPASLEFDPAYQGEVAVPEAPDFSSLSPKGQWGRMLVLGDEIETRLVNWLSDELDKCYTERQPILDDWTRWQADYWATPESPEKNFPFKRAANIVIPLTAISVEAIYARLMTTLFAVKPFWSIRPKAKSWVEAAPKLEEWLQTEVENENALSLYEFSEDCIMELVKLGTCVGKSGYERVIKKGGDGRWVEVKNGASLDYVPLANFLIRIGEHDPQKSAWCGEEHEFTWTQLKRMALAGRISSEAVEKIKMHWGVQNMQAGSSREYQEKLDEELNIEVVWNEKFNCQEIWCAFDVDNDGVDEEIVLDFHRDSRTILSIRYNWYADLHRPYRIANYIPVEGRIYGVGVGKQNEQFQKEITTIHRQRLDNATLANMRMFAVKKTSQYGPGEALFPGKMWFFDDPGDIQPVQMAEVYNSAYANEDGVLRYSEKRTGVNEVLLGMPAQGTPGTATGDLARIQEGTKKFDLVFENVIRWFGLIGQDVVSNYQQYGDQQRHWLVQEEEGGWVEQILSMPQDLVVHGAIVEVNKTDSSVNPQVQQQQLLSLFQVAKQYYADRLGLEMQLAQMMGNPQRLMMAADAAMIASEELYRRLLDTFPGIKDKEKLLMNPLLPPMNGPAQPNAGGMAGTQVAPAAPGMAALPELAALLGGGPPGPGGGVV